MFRSALQRIYNPDSRVSRETSEVGSPLVQLYRSKFSREGVLELVPDGEHNLYDEIQSHAQSTDINMILQRYFSGDAAALSRIQGVYADISEMPSNYHDAMTLIDNARKDFAKLPVEIQAKFGNDANQWIAQMGSDTWLSAMGIVSDSSAAAAPAAPDVTDVPVAPAAPAASAAVGGDINEP